MIGISTIKGLAFGNENVKCIPVSALESLCENVSDEQKGTVICACMDARRNQVYTGIYRFENDFEVVEEQMAIPVQELIEKLNAYGKKVTFLGDGVPVYGEQLKAGLTVEYAFAPAHMNRQSAAAVGALGMKYFAEGKIESARDHEPDYLRLSQAERERAEKNASLS